MAGSGRLAAESALRAAIAEGDLLPGARLVEADLVAMLGVSRGNVRLAIDALDAEGLVERIPNRGARIRVISTDEAVAITEARMALEALIARKAAERVTEAEADRLRAHLHAMAAAVESGDVLKYSELIQQLHGLVAEAARHPVAANLVGLLQAQLVRHQFRLSCGRAPPGRPWRADRAGAGDQRPRRRPRRGRGRHAFPQRHLGAVRADPARRPSMRNVVVTDPPRADPGDAEQLGGFGVATVHEALGRVGYLGPEIRPAWYGARIGGTAVTVLCWPGDNLMIHAAVEQCRPGDILVVTTNSPSTDGLFGELFATALAHRGVRGLVTRRGPRRRRPARDGVPGVVRGGQCAGHGEGHRRFGQRAGRARRPDRAARRRGVADDDGVIVVPRADVPRAPTASQARAQGGASRAAFRQGELGLDRYGLRDTLPDLGVEYVALREVRRRRQR